MRIAIGLALAIALVPGVNAIEGHVASFATPAQWDGHASVTSQWAVVVMGPPDEAVAQLHVEPGTTVHYQALRSQFRSEAVAVDDAQPLSPSSEQAHGEIRGEASFKAGAWKSLYIQAARIDFAFDAAGQIIAQPQDTSVTGIIPPSWPRGTVRPGSHPLVDDSVAIAGKVIVGTSWRLTATGIRSVEIHNGTIRCETKSCPSTGDQNDPVTAGELASLELLQYLELQAANGTMSMAGTAYAAAAGASKLDIALSGQARIAGFQLSRTCNSSSCIEANGETLIANGNLTFTGLQMEPGSDRVNGHVQLTEGSARLDETAVDADILGAGAAIAGAVAISGILVAKLLGLLFTRIRKSQALEHPNRRRLLDAITSIPGMSFTALLQTTGLSAGTARHHLNILSTLDLIQMTPVGTSVRHYPQGLQQGQRIGLAVLQSDHARDICAAIAAHPRITQRGVLLALGGRLPRSSIQFKLRQLTESQVLTAERAGKRVLYAPGKFFPHATEVAALPLAELKLQA